MFETFVPDKTCQTVLHGKDASGSLRGYLKVLRHMVMMFGSKAKIVKCPCLKHTTIRIIRWPNIFGITCF